jgi:coenzyme PQQ biosynthesis protein C
MTELLSPEQLEERLRAIGAARYHSLHPFHELLHTGRLNFGQVQAWALNRYYYQCNIPIKDSVVLSRLTSVEDRRAWRQRIIDHDGSQPGEGGIARWLKLTEGLHLDTAYVESCAGILPTTRFAVEAYVHFTRDRTVLEAVASSLTEMFSPGIIQNRVAGMLANYDFVGGDTLAYFDKRLSQAPRDADFALDYVKEHATTPETQAAAIAALTFKCDVLWSQLDALHHAYVDPGLPPPGAWKPGEEGRAWR